MALTVVEKRRLGTKRAAKRFYIKAALDERGYSLQKVADELGITYEAVHRVISGKGHSKRVLQKLREIGVPEKYLFDPYVLEAVAV